ncbi:MAG: hypothetical protein ACD_37C00141G0003 [uncultured bacterium]|nr:MAG: hypothetical protein ACD_37C00141G0003 [uncultured bacterium]
MIFRKFSFKNYFTVSLICLLLLSLFLRFYNYQNRWGLALDQAHDGLIARYALGALKIPLVGPFSSAGPMQTGGEWYWFIMLGTVFNKSEVMSPWIFLTLTYVLFVLLITLLGKELISKNFGILLGILSLVSTAQIAQSANLTNQSPLALFSLFAIWSMVKYVKTKKLIYLFFLGFNVSLAAMFHFQGAALMVLVLTTIILSRVNLKGFIIILCGLFVPVIPLLLFDLKNDFVNIRNIIQYELHDQYKISLDVLGRRWKTYAGIFWPNAWSHVIGGYSFNGYVLLAGLGIVTLYSFLKKNLSKEWQIIILSFLGMVVVLRYIRTPLYDSYIVFLHPFIFLLTGWFIYTILKKNRFIGLVIFTIIVVFSLIKDSKELNYNKANESALEVSSEVKLLSEKFPNQKFSIYSYKYQSAGKNFILALFLDAKDLIDDNGIRIGIVESTESGVLKFPVLQGDVSGLRLLDLSSSTSDELKNSNWANVNPKQIYYATEEWYTK